MMTRLTIVLFWQDLTHTSFLNEVQVEVQHLRSTLAFADEFFKIRIRIRNINGLSYVFQLNKDHDFDFDNQK